MTNKRATKRALLTSVLAICLCLVMLIGSTFAWFTDTASTGVNKIQAGNLDVQLLMRGENGYTNIGDSKEPIFGSTSNVAQNNNQDTLWEPGKTQVAYLAVRNAGNLALKYNINLNVVDGGLAEALQYVIVPQGTRFGTDKPTDLTDVANWADAQTRGGTVEQLPTTGTHVAAPDGCLDEIAKGSQYSNETEYFALVVHMKEEAGNTYMDKTVTIDIQVQATQAAAESDSFNNTYDESATLPTFVAGQTDLKTAIDEGKTNLSLGEGTYTLYQVSDKTQNTSLTIEGAGADKTTMNAYNSATPGGENNADYSYEGSEVVFKNITVNLGTGDYRGIIRARSLYFENCVIEGRGSYWGTGTVVFKNCTFQNDDDYLITTYAGADFTFDGCTFKSTAGKFVNAYKEVKTDITPLTFINCTFSSPDNSSKAAVCLKSYKGQEWKLSFTNCNVDNCKADGDEKDMKTGSVYYSVRSSDNDGVCPAATTVIIDNVVVWENGATKK